MKIQCKKFNIKDKTFFGGNNTNTKFGIAQCHGKNMMEGVRRYCCLWKSHEKIQFLSGWLSDVTTVCVVVYKLLAEILAKTGVKKNCILLSLFWLISHY